MRGAWCGLAGEFGAGVGQAEAAGDLVGDLVGVDLVGVGVDFGEEAEHGLEPGSVAGDVKAELLEAPDIVAVGALNFQTEGKERLRRHLSGPKHVRDGLGR